MSSCLTTENFYVPSEWETYGETGFDYATHFLDYKNTPLDRTNNYSIVIPAYNEEYRIEKTLVDLLKILEPNDEIIVVFDGNDNTPDVVRRVSPQIKLIISPTRLGKGGAILEGFKVASHDIVGFIDADNSVKAEDVLKLAEMVSFEEPCVIASRWVRSSEINKREPFLNVFAGRMFHYLLFIVLGLRVKDTQCGAKFFHKSLLDLILDKITVKNRVFDVAILFQTSGLNKPIKEVGIRWSHDNNTRLPIRKVIPLMFATIIGLRVVHSKRLKVKEDIIRKLSDEFDFY